MSENVNIPSDDELREMSREELVELGGKIDGVTTVFKEPRWPVEGTKAEKRAERQVAAWLLLGGLSGLALLLVFLFWPWEYKPFESEGEFIYSLATPLYGLTFGLSILAIGIGAAVVLLGCAMAGALAWGRAARLFALRALAEDAHARG